MQLRRSERVLVVLLPFLGLVSACNALTGVNDLEIDRTQPGGDASAEASAEADVSVGPDSTPDQESGVEAEASVTQDADAAAPEADAPNLEDAEAAVPADADATAPTDGDAGEPLDAEAAVPTDADATVPTDGDAGEPLDADASVPSDVADVVTEDTPDVQDALEEEAAWCGVLPGDVTDVYVDVNSTSGTGAPGCPVKSIALGLSLLQASTTTAQRTLHIASGAYGANSGDTLPVKVEFSVRIVGAGNGPSGTRIVGAGPYSGAAWGGTFATEPNARSALVVLTKLPVRIEAIRFEAPQIGDQDYGIVCTTGNATDIAAPINLEVNNVHITRHRAGILATNATIPAVGACGLKVTNSIFDENRSGIWVVGAGLGPNTGAVAAVIGEGPGSGNVFKDNLEDLHPGAAGVTLWDGLSIITIRNNTFTHNLRGVEVGYHSEKNVNNPQNVTIENNTFSTHTNAGVHVSPQAVLKDLIGNTFESNVGTPAVAVYGLLMKGNNVATDVSGVANARNNIFRNNDFGVFLENTSYHSDFGHSGSPGNNIFACNSTAAFWGTDVQIKNCTGTMTLVGNQWNHVPPSSGSVDGTDLLVVNSPVPNSSDSSLSSQTCDSTHIP